MLYVQLLLSCFLLWQLYTHKNLILTLVCKLIMHDTKSISRWHISEFRSKAKRYGFVSKKIKALEKEIPLREKPRNGKSKVKLKLRSVLQWPQIANKTSPHPQGDSKSGGKIPSLEIPSLALQVSLRACGKGSCCQIHLYFPTGSNSLVLFSTHLVNKSFLWGIEVNGSSRSSALQRKSSSCSVLPCFRQVLSPLRWKESR